MSNEGMSQPVVEVVKVNQQAMMTKVLTRYSTHFSVIRELLQNADDAGASKAEIRFKTARKYVESDETTLASEIQKVVFYEVELRNNGKPFEPDDWSRIMTIGEGNPDAHKVGAFGIGFYNVFSIAKEATVNSGGNMTYFYMHYII